ncbi:Tex family protein [Selenomonas sp.]|uniref:Tex family protein n=1 Tax=Selenomonas sp. TaxID=2053611 RepID=UPI0025F33486|nr:Tex family protein [Selenomonas sp.]MCI6284294.1 RNA-binding transcriptional accessory protein [Selenomonas sp.]
MQAKEIDNIIARELGVRREQVAKAIELLDAGNTVPFIARYRKEATGALEDEQLRTLAERLAYLRGLVKRQEDICASIAAQGKLTPELQAAIDSATKLQELEDLYLPYKQKRRTRAQMAREKGLQPLADAMMAQKETQGTALAYAETFLADACANASDATDDGATTFPIPEGLTAEDALAGARDIVAEVVSEDAKLRQQLRKSLWQTGVLKTELIETKNDKQPEDTQTFLMYADYSEPIRTLPSHRVLAINRGEKKGCLRVRIDFGHEAAVDKMFAHIFRRKCIFTDELRAALEDGENRLLFPALEREVRAQLTENAEAQAIHVFGVNLRQLLLQAPLGGHVVMGLDPGYRTGCKMAVVDATGRVLDHGVLQVTKSDAEREASAKTVLALIKKHHVTLLSIGNGTASYETEQFAANLIAEHHLTDVHYLITNEAGASVYSASKLAKEELPDYDVTIRGAVSIARRVQDPLAELVKIDPQAIGVGQYQHDVNQKALGEALDAVIEAAVNHVGVDLNTASPALLAHIAGITASTAKNIVAWRDANGRFDGRRQLLKVPRLGPAAFTQCAGFLRIHGGTSPLDDTPVHPESYALAEKILAKLGFALDDLTKKDELDLLAAKRKLLTKEKEAALAKELGAGLPTVHDILDALVAPGRDPREDLPAPLTRQAIVKLSDIQPGTILRGTVRNITDFGAFVDIGIKTAGLIHISQLAKRRVKHPLDVVSIGDILNVKVLSVDEQRGRIGLTLKGVPQDGTGKEVRA